MRATAGHDELKRALGTTDAAVLKLRRVAPKPKEYVPALKAATAPVNKPVVDSGGGGFFGCCATRPVGA